MASQSTASRKRSALSLEANEKKEKRNKVADDVDARLWFEEAEAKDGQEARINGLLSDAFAALEEMIRKTDRRNFDTFRFKSGKQFLSRVVQAKGILPTAVRTNLLKTVPSTVALFDSWCAANRHTGKCDIRLVNLFRAFYVSPGECKTGEYGTEECKTEEYLWVRYFDSSGGQVAKMDLNDSFDSMYKHFVPFPSTDELKHALQGFHNFISERHISSFYSSSTSTDDGDHEDEDDDDDEKDCGAEGDDTTSDSNKNSGDAVLPPLSALMTLNQAMASIMILSLAVYIDSQLDGLFSGGTNPYVQAMVNYSKDLEIAPPVMVSPGEIVCVSVALGVEANGGGRGRGGGDTHEFGSFLVPLKVTAVRVMKPQCTTTSPYSSVVKYNSTGGSLCATEVWEYDSRQCEGYQILGNIPGFEALPGCCYLKCQLADEVMERANAILDVLHSAGYPYDAPRQPLTKQKFDSVPIETALSGDSNFEQLTADQVVRTIHKEWMRAEPEELEYMATKDARVYLRTIQSFMENLIAHTGRTKGVPSTSPLSTAEPRSCEEDEKEQEEARTEKKEKEEYGKWYRSEQAKKWMSATTIRDGILPRHRALDYQKEVRKMHSINESWLPARQEAERLLRMHPSSAHRVKQLLATEVENAFSFMAYRVGGKCAPRFVAADWFSSTLTDLSALLTRDVASLVLDDYCDFKIGPPSRFVPFLLTALLPRPEDDD